MSPAVALLIMVVLLTLNGLFVASEFALILARRTKLEPAAAAGSRTARMALRGIETGAALVILAFGSLLLLGYLTSERLPLC